MSYFEANGHPIEPFPTAFNASNVPQEGVYYACPNCGDASGDPPYDDARDYMEARVIVPGVGEIGTKRNIPFGTKRIYAELIFVGTKAQCETRRQSLMASFEQLARYTVSLPSGPSFNGCKMVGGSGHKTKQMNIGGMVCMFCNFEFVQLSTTN
jgi:hypothetical protein